MWNMLGDPAQLPVLSEGRVAEMRTHLLDELDRVSPFRRAWNQVRVLVRGRRRRLALVVVALAGVYAFPAIAQDQVFWWVNGPDDPFRPVTKVVTVTRGWTNSKLSFTASGEHWTMQAFVSKEDGLCVGVSPDPPRPANEGSAMGCGFPVHGIDRPQPVDPSHTHWVGVMSGVPGGTSRPGPKYIWGPASSEVRTVDLETSEDRLITVPTIAPSEALGLPARFWVVVLPVEEVVRVLIPRDAEGKALEHWNLDVAQ